MPILGKTHAVKHARSFGPRFGSVAAVTFLVAGAITIEAYADARGRGSRTSGVSARSAHSRPAASPGRYRNYGQVRGGTGAAPVRQPNLPHALSGLGTVQHIERSRQRFHLPPGHVGHRAPRVIYVPVAYAQQPAPDPIIVVQQAPPQPQQPIVIRVQQAPAGRDATIPPPPPAPPRPTSNEPGTLRFSVLPADAEVVLDDLRLGSPAELLASDRRVAPGIHVLVVTHPAHVAERVVFAVEPGHLRKVSIDLRESRPSRRTRID